MTRFIPLLLTIALSPNLAKSQITHFDFESVPIPYTILHLDGYSDKDFTMQHSQAPIPGLYSFGNILTPAHEQTDEFVGDGTARILAFNASTLTLFKNDFGHFDLVSFLGGETDLDPLHSKATQISVTGYGDWGSKTAVFDLDLIKDPINGMQLFSLSDFTDLTSVSFTGIGGRFGGKPEFSLDDIQLRTAAVPEPSTYGLIGAAGLVVAACMRKRLKVARK